MSLRAVFFGSPAFAVPCLRALAGAAGVEVRAAVSQPDRPAGRGQAPTPPAVKREAEALGIPVLQFEKVRTPETAAALEALNADLFVVVAYGRILPQALLDLPRLGPALMRELAAQVEAIRAVAGEALRILSDDDLRPRYVAHLPA